MRSRRYDEDVLVPPPRKLAALTRVVAEPGLVIEDSAGEFCGVIVGCEKDAVTLEDRHGKRRVFPLTSTFLLDGRRVALVRPVHGQRPGPARTASGSIAPPASRARVARASRIYVEGQHDAELVEKVWGDDLRDVGVVVEPLHGIDDLPEIVAEFAPEPGRRLGVLVDHLIDGSKESKIAARVTCEHVLVVGHPYVDIWAAVKPASLGIPRWPEVPKHVPWKQGVLAALGWPPDPALGWRRILGRVRSYADLEPAFLGRVEELIDFVTAAGSR
ncbi:MAG: DUF3097 domain-containing protein [Streptosporangiaceae bacterium]